MKNLKPVWDIRDERRQLKQFTLRYEASKYLMKPHAEIFQELKKHTEAKIRLFEKLDEVPPDKQDLEETE